MSNDDETQKPVFIVDWYNESLLADIWFSKKTVTAENAATLLCGLNPSSANTITHDLLHLDCKYNDLMTLFEGHRCNLLGFVDLARHRQLPYHPWIDEYLTALEVLNGKVDPVQSMPPPPRQKATSNHAEKIRAAALELGVDLKDHPTVKNGLPSPTRKTLYAHLVKDRRVLTDSTFKRGWECLFKDLRESSST